MNSNPQTYRILIVGSRHVGKSKLIDRLMEKPFTEMYTPTQNQSCLSYNIELQSQTFNLQITEMSKIPFKLFQSSAIPQFDYIIFVYDVCKLSTWHDLKKYKEQIEKYLDNSSGVRYFIIGNKTDKENSINIAQITFFAPHFEISAKSQELNPKEACLHIWQNAQYFNHTTSPATSQPIAIQNLANVKETQFKVSIPTSLTRISGSGDIAGILRVVLIGSASVGKSEFHKFIYGEQPFNSEYVPTIGVDFRLMTVRFQKKDYKLQLWDTSGVKKFRAITTCYYRAINIAIYVYDITNRASFEEIKQFQSEMIQHNQNSHEQVLSVLIGNKTDLSNQRQVSLQEGEKLASQMKIKLFQTSVKQSHGVMEAFLSTLEQFLTQKKI